jgi:hypothetical protein
MWLLQYWLGIGIMVAIFFWYHKEDRTWFYLVGAILMLVFWPFGLVYLRITRRDYR